MGDGAVTSFLGCCVSLLQILMEVTDQLNLIGCPLSFIHHSVSTKDPQTTTDNTPASCAWCPSASVCSIMPPSDNIQHAQHAALVFFSSCIHCLLAISSPLNLFLPLLVVMQADSAVEEVPPPELSVEEAWCGAEGPASIAELALEQKGVHFPLVQHHFLLASLLHAAMTFGVKVKPLSLFDSKVRACPL